MIGRMSTVPSRSSVLLPAVLIACLFTSAPVFAKTYSAERYDSIVRLLPDGALDVIETVVFRFESGTFKEVFREIPLRRTDGIEVLEARMQGTTLPFGTEPGTVQVRNRGNRVRVTWRFTPIDGVTREFAVRYRVRGAVRREAAADLLIWRALPGQHDYRIDSSTIDFEMPVPPAADPEVETRRTDPPRVSSDGTRLRLEAGSIRRNGWIETSLRFPPGTIVSSLPAWQEHEAEVAAGASRWIIAASALAGAGLVLLITLRQTYDPPPSDAEGHRESAHQAFPPDGLDAVLTGVLVSNGQPTLQHAMATLFLLADRGELEIHERRGALRQREFILTRGRGTLPLKGSEQTVLDAAFKGDASPGRTVTLSTARSRLSMRFGRFGRAVTDELAGGGLLDPGRYAVRQRYTRVGIALLVAAGLAAVPAIFLGREHGAWTLLIPAAMVALSVAAFIFASATTPLSNDGVRRAGRWRAYRKHLAAVAQGKEPSPGMPAAAVLPFAVSFGLASSWSKYLKRQGFPVPAWFHAIEPGNPAGFPAFVAAGGAGTSGGGGSVAGAGGGASGAR